MTKTAHLPRIDWKAERDKVDLAAVATGLLGPAPGRRGERGRKLWWSCPFHEDRNPSFCVEPGKATWRCYGCGEHGDAAALVMRIQNLSFPMAVAYLVGGPNPSGTPRTAMAPKSRPAPRPEPQASGLTEAAAQALVEDAELRLWTPEGADALAYLRGPKRGLRDETIRAARLGWTPSVQLPRKGGSGTYQATGIVVPWFDGDRLTLVKVRQPAERRPKYAEAFRSADFTSLYPGRRMIRQGEPLVVVEGEFDALLLGQELGELAAVVTLGSASSRPTDEILDLMVISPRWYLAHDADEAGDEAAKAWPESARRVRPPTLRTHPADGVAKESTDWSDLRTFGVDLRRWWSDRLAGTDRPPLFTWEELAGWRWGPGEDDPEPGIVVD